MENKRTWACVKKPLQVIVTPHDNFLFGFGFIPSSPHFPQQCCGPKSTHFHPFCAKFNFVWGGRGGVTSFSNTTGKVQTLLTSIVAPCNGIQEQYWTQDPMLWTPDARYWIVDSLSMELSFWISIVYGGIPDSFSCIPDSKLSIRYSVSQNIPDSRFHCKNFSVFRNWDSFTMYAASILYFNCLK